MKYIKLLSLFLVSLATLPTHAQTKMWQDSLSNAVVYLQIDRQDYHRHPHRTAAGYEVIESQEDFHDVILRTTHATLRKYPTRVLNEHVNKLYMYDQFDKGDELMGVYRGRHGFLFAVPYLENGQVDTLDLERVIHHEISHRLLMFEGQYFELKAWKNNNGLRYGKIKSFNRAFAPELYAKGFLNKFAVMNKFEDFAAFAENIFINKPEFWQAIEAHPALRNKFEIICSFFEALDPQMDLAYFLQMNGVSLDSDR